MDRNKITFTFCLMLLGHVAHVFEEVWGHFWLLDVFGLGGYLVGNWILFCVPVVLFCFVLQAKRWACLLSMAYAAFMVLQGVGHNAATLLTGRYFHGFAGGATGIALVLIGAPLLYSLWKGLPPRAIDVRGA